MLLSTTWANVQVVEASSTPTTSISISTPYNGSLMDGGFVYTSANPHIALNVTLPQGSSLISTEYKTDINPVVNNYQAPFTINSNHTSSFELSYRSNATSGLEPWKSLEIFVDADAPVFTLSSGNSTSIERYISNRSILLSSNANPLLISCNDALSGLNTISGNIENVSVNGTNGILEVSPQSMPFISSLNGTLLANVQCSDNVGNLDNYNFSFVVDNSIPEISIQTTGYRNGTCTSEDWKIHATSLDNHSDSFIEFFNNGIWQSYTTNLTFPSGYNGTIELRAVDTMGYQSNAVSYDVYVDNIKPAITTNISNNELVYSVYDSCQITQKLIRWETYQGFLSPWSLLPNQSVYTPNSLDGSVLRAHLLVEDEIGNSETSTTQWMQTNGSLPRISIYELSDFYGTYASPYFSLILVSQGFQSSSNYTLLVNNLSLLNGSVNSMSQLQYNFTDGDYVNLYSESVGPLNITNHQNYSWFIDGKNNQLQTIFTSGPTVTNANNLIIGPTTGFTHLPAMDDVVGVGADFVECSWDGLYWYTSQNNLVKPQVNSTQTQDFTFACRNVDKLGNKGNISWLNGTLDSTPPSILIAPQATNLLSPESEINVQINDYSGISAIQYQFTWKNNNISYYANFSGVNSNWSEKIDQIFPQVSDGEVFLTVTSSDNVGNLVIDSTYSWYLNTTIPSTQVQIINGSGDFLPSTNSTLRVIPTTQNWPGVWMNYSLEFNGTTIFAGNITSLVELNPIFTADGQALLNVITGDSFGQSQNQSWIFNVDSSITEIPIYTILGPNISQSNSYILGTQSAIMLTNVVDDSHGVGGAMASCSIDSINWFDVNNGDFIYPSTFQTTGQQLTLTCKNIDYFGNVGQANNISFFLDNTKPNNHLSPNQTYLAPLTLLEVYASDNYGLDATQLMLQWSDGLNSIYVNRSIYGGYWNNTIQALFGNIPSGIITASLTTVDALGNVRLTSGYSFILTIQQPTIAFTQINGFFNNHISSNSATFMISGQSGGNGQYNLDYMITYQNGTLIEYGTANGPIEITIENLLEDQLTLSVSITDYYNRTQNNSWYYYVDGSVGTLPNFVISGPNVNSTGNIWLGLPSLIHITNRLDSPTGVGHYQTKCSWDNVNWFLVNDNQSLSPLNNLPNQHSNQNLGCKNVDILGNEGNISWFNFSLDSKEPTHSLMPDLQTVVAPNTLLQFYNSDENGILNSSIDITWTNGANSWFESVPVYNNWTNTLAGVRSGLSDGTVTIQLITTDNLGNTRITNGINWVLNTTIPTFQISLAGDVSGNYLGNNFSVTISPQSHGFNSAIVNVSFESSGNLILNDSTNNTATYHFSNMDGINNGTFYLNTTTTDMFNRINNQTLQFIVDRAISTTPLIQLTGVTQSINNITVVGPASSILVLGGLDDSWGVGFESTICSWDGQNWFTVGTSGLINLNSTTGTIQNFQIHCRNVDLLGNLGPITTKSGVVDNKLPEVFFPTLEGTLLSDMTTISTSCSDYSGCNLLYISGKFITGNSLSWHHFALSGANSSLPLSNLLNVSLDGTITFYIGSEDSVGNIVNESTFVYQYTHGAPTTVISIDSINHQNFVNSNLSFSIIPSTGWLSGVSVNLSVEYIQNSSQLIQRAVNQSTATISLFDLPEGELEISTEICNNVVNCTESNVILIVDSTGPSSPILSSPESHHLPNGSMVGKATTNIHFESGFDTESSTYHTWCNYNSQTYIFNSQNTTLSLSSLVNSGEWIDIVCYSMDQVGNIGNSSYITVLRDDESPIVELIGLPNDGIVTPSMLLGATCDSKYPTARYLSFISQGSLINDFNSSSNISLNAGDILPSTYSANLEIYLFCIDEVGNSNYTSTTIEWLPYLMPSNLSISSIVTNNIHYISMQSTFDITNQRQDVSHKIKYHNNTYSSDWELLSSRNFKLIDLYPNLTNNDDVIFELMTYRSNTNLQNISFSQYFKIDTAGPVVVIANISSYGNSTNIQISSSDFGVGSGIKYYWNFNNATVFESFNSQDILLPNGLDDEVWFTVWCSDIFGNVGNSESTLLSRDFTAPVINLTKSNNNFIGLNSSYSISIYETTGIESSFVKILSADGQEYYLANHTTNFSFSSTDIPSNMLLGQNLILTIEAISTSRIITTFTENFLIDISPPETSINQLNSINISQFNTSNHTTIYFDISSDMQDICYLIRDNVSTTSNQCMPLQNQTLSLNRIQGSYIVELNSIDFAGNTNQNTFQLVHHTNLPTIAYNLTAVLAPHESQTIHYSPDFGASVMLSWNGLQLPNSLGTFTIPSTDGINILEVQVTNALGLSNEESISINVDSKAPDMTLESTMTAQKSGTNTIFWFNSTDMNSSLIDVDLIVQGNQISCSISFTPISLQYSITGTLSEIFTGQNCSLLDSTHVHLDILFQTKDGVGNIGQIMNSTNYYGSINDPTFVTARTHLSNNTYNVGPKSSIQCIQPLGSINPTTTLNWTGQVANISNLVITNISSDGVLTCTAIDIFGNTASITATLSLDETSPELDIIWPSNSYGNLVKSSGAPFSINFSDYESPILSVKYCVSNSTCSPDLDYQGFVNFNATVGVHYLYVEVESLIGLVSANSTMFILDNAAPIQNLTSGQNSTIIGSIIYIGHFHSEIEITVNDDHCLQSTIIETDQGQTSIPQGTNFIQYLSPYTTFVTVSSMDCIGHSVIENFTVHTIDGINITTFSIPSNNSHLGFFDNHNQLTFSRQINLSNFMNHPIPLIISCNSFTAVVSCGNINVQNIFEATVNSTINGSISVLYTDAVGNRLYGNLTYFVDNVGPSCNVQNHASIYANWLFASSQFPSEFSCEDSNQVSNVAWLSSNGIYYNWQEQNQIWVAPPPPIGGSVAIVATDNLSNIEMTILGLQIDDDAPILTYSQSDSVSFSEGFARSDANFTVDCVDSIQSYCMILVRHYGNNGILLHSENFTNEGNIAIQSQNGATEIIEIILTDPTGNMKSVTNTLIIDDISPYYNLTWYNQISMELIEIPIIPHDGIIKVDNLFSNDVNYTLSSIRIICRDNGDVLLESSLLMSIDLSDINLQNCEKIEFSSSISDYVKNTRNKYIDLYIDYFQPEATISLDSTCSWYSGIRYDATPVCELNVSLTDDVLSHLLGNYEILIQSTSTNQSKTVAFSGSLSGSELINFNSQEVLISLSGSDLVGNEISSTPIVASLRTSFEPIWFGVTCADNLQCEISGQSFMSPSANTDTIGFSVRPGEAPIVESNLVFQRGGIFEENFDTNIIGVNQISEGNWIISGNFTDAAGRTYSIDGLSIIYDTSSPIIEIDNTRSVGYLPDKDSILSCEVCKIYISVEDVTELDLILSVDFTVENGYFVIPTATLSTDTVFLSATDAFGRESNISLTVVELNSTMIDVSGYLQGAQTLSYCIEESGNVDYREVVCLWRRETAVLTNLTIPFGVSVDKPELRDVRLITVADGTITRSFSVTSETFEISNIPYYTSELFISLDDNFSEAKPIKVRLIEHTEPWDGFNLADSTLNESDITSTFDVRFDPPIGQDQFYIVKGGNGGLVEWLQCSTQYQFMQVNRPIPVVIAKENCEIKSVRLRTDGTMQVNFQINHSSIRTDAGLFEHQNYLFNLASISVKFQYFDLLDVTETTDYSDLTIDANQIKRSPNQETQFISDVCQLGYNLEINSQDGFLQSDNTLKLNECVDSFYDPDGIEATIWNFTFFNSIGEITYSIEIECEETFFPLSWALQDAFNSGRCVDPGRPFPSGVFDVIVKPIILDGSVYSEDGKLQLNYSPLFGNQSECTDASNLCYIQVGINSVSVYASYDPALEVENAAEFVDKWKANPGIFVISFNVFLFGVVIYFIRRNLGKE